MTFPDPYIPHNICPLYKGEPVRLNPYEEELVWYWCQTIGSEWEENEYYRANFIKQFMKRFEKEGKYTDFSEFDFAPVKAHFEKVREEKKNLTDKKKAEIKASKEELNKFYGFAIVDGVR